MQCYIAVDVDGCWVSKLLQLRDIVRFSIQVDGISLQLGQVCRKPRLQSSTKLLSRTNVYSASDYV